MTTMAELRVIELDRPSLRAAAMLFVWVVVAPTALTGLAQIGAGLLARAPGPMVLGAVAAASVLVYGALALATTRRTVTFTAKGLTVRSSFYTVVVERSAIRASEICTGDGNRDPACMPATRTNGLSMPGFHSGWFRTRTAEKAFFALAGPRCVRVPTTQGFLLILGVRDPDAVARLLKAAL